MVTLGNGGTGVGRGAAGIAAIDGHARKRCNRFWESGECE
jgi:hypothetical protein